MHVTLLYGDMGQELLERSKKAPTGFWSTQFLIDMPILMREEHSDYSSAGADEKEKRSERLGHKLKGDLV